MRKEWLVLITIPYPTLGRAVQLTTMIFEDGRLCPSTIENVQSLSYIRVMCPALRPHDVTGYLYRGKKAYPSMELYTEYTPQSCTLVHTTYTNTKLSVPVLGSGAFLFG